MDELVVEWRWRWWRSWWWSSPAVAVVVVEGRAEAVEVLAELCSPVAQPGVVLNVPSKRLRRLANTYLTPTSIFAQKLGHILHVFLPYLGLEHMLNSPQNEGVHLVPLMGKIFVVGLMIVI